MPKIFDSCLGKILNFEFAVFFGISSVQHLQIVFSEFSCLRSALCIYSLNFIHVCLNYFIVRITYRKKLSTHIITLLLLKIIIIIPNAEKKLLK